MHLEQLWIENASDPADGEWKFAASKEAIRKWNVLARDRNTGALPVFVALACAGSRQVEAMRRWLPPVRPREGGPVRVEFVLARHAPQECGLHAPSRESSGWQLWADGTIIPLQKHEASHLSPPSPFASPHLGSGNAGWLLLGYGGQVRAHDGTDAFDFRDPNHRLKRVASLFDPPALWTRTLPIPQPLPRPPPARPARLPRGTVLLVDVDSQLPNLALMKLGRHFQSQGKRVALARPSTRMPRAETVFASCVFAFPQSARRVELLRRLYGADMQVGVRVWT